MTKQQEAINNLPEEEKKHELSFVGSMYEQERQFYYQKFSFFLFVNHSEKNLN